MKLKDAIMRVVNESEEDLNINYRNPCCDMCDAFKIVVEAAMEKEGINWDDILSLDTCEGCVDEDNLSDICEDCESINGKRPSNYRERN